MNTKVAVGLLAAIILLVIAFFAFNHPASTPLVPTATTTTAASSTGVGVSASTGVKTSPVLAPATTNPKGTSAGTVTQARKDAAFDQMNIVTTSEKPTLTGTANTLEVAIVINNSANVGIAGAGNIPVVNGHWSYTAPIQLTPGTYTIQLAGGENVVTAHLTVSGS